MRLRTILNIGVCAGAMIFAVPVAAQTSDAVAEVPEPQDGLDEIVVTAQRGEESLQPRTYGVRGSVRF